LFRSLSRLLVVLCALALPAQAQQNLMSPRDAGVAPWLGMNLTELRDFHPQRPFIDVMKQARDWTGHIRGQWGGWTEADLRAAGALDENGWPVFVPPQLEGIAALILVDLEPDAGGVAGMYRVTFDGDGELALEGRVGRTRRLGPQEVWFNFTPGEGLVQLIIRRTNPPTRSATSALCMRAISRPMMRGRCSTPTGWRAWTGWRCSVSWNGQTPITPRTSHGTTALRTRNEIMESRVCGWTFSECSDSLLVKQVLKRESIDDDRQSWDQGTF
jgi:hypothetical protein